MKQLDVFRTVLIDVARGGAKQVFDCKAANDASASALAEAAYPGCRVLETYLRKAHSDAYVIYSANEAANSDGAGFWSNSYGWTMLQDATVFSDAERHLFLLPHSAGLDAFWVERAAAKYL